ncbi:MAG: radical SAM/SPASM domain-containing protein [Betaproteobacteria bacterium]
MSKVTGSLTLARSLLANPRIILAKPAVNWFLLQYLRRFTPTQAGDHLVLHSHLPPVNSRAYSRFINEHLLGRNSGPSHAQVGLTNVCPHDCEYCYNRDRTGEVMDTARVLKVIRDLRAMGVFWLGFTGGEPLLRKDLVKITESAADGCAVKMFTTGATLTRELAADLQRAGLFSVSVSLDHWRAAEHDRVRRCPGAHQTALKAIEMFQEVGGVHVGVSTVVSRDLLEGGQLEEFLHFLIGLGVQEAWLSETKPSVENLWSPALVLNDEERARLVALQDRYNREGRLTVNYLGHFEGPDHFGCAAGHKMVYVDAFGNVGPCVFVPLSFGNVRERPVKEIVQEMRTHFPSERQCFLDRNCTLLKKHYRGESPFRPETSLEVMKEAQFGPLATFFALQYR